MILSFLYKQTSFAIDYFTKLKTTTDHSYANEYARINFDCYILIMDLFCSR
jgi:hypothetical protein